MRASYENDLYIVGMAWRTRKMHEKKKSSTMLSTVPKFVHHKNNSGMAYMSHENLYSIGIKIFAARKHCMFGSCVHCYTFAQFLSTIGNFFLHP
jgi:hypothetical protein